MSDPVTVLLDTIRNSARGEVGSAGVWWRGRLTWVERQWKVLVLDAASRKVIDNVVREDDILNENVTSMASPRAA